MYFNAWRNCFFFAIGELAIFFFFLRSFVFAGFFAAVSFRYFKHVVRQRSEVEGS